MATNRLPTRNCHGKIGVSGNARCTSRRPKIRRRRIGSIGKGRQGNAMGFSTRIEGNLRVTASARRGGRRFALRRSSRGQCYAGIFRRRTGSSTKSRSISNSGGGVSVGGIVPSDRCSDRIITGRLTGLESDIKSLSSRRYVNDRSLSAATRRHWGCSACGPCSVGSVTNDVPTLENFKVRMIGGPLT